MTGLELADARARERWRQIERLEPREQMARHLTECTAFAADSAESAAYDAAFTRELERRCGFVPTADEVATGTAELRHHWGQASAHAARQLLADFDSRMDQRYGSRPGEKPTTGSTPSFMASPERLRAHAEAVRERKAAEAAFVQLTTALEARRQSPWGPHTPDRRFEASRRDNE